MGATPITRKFFLFFEEFVDPSLNVPHCAYITLASRMRYGGQECCSMPEFQFDTKIMRDTWGMAGGAGWHVAEIFDTGREKQCGHGHYHYSYSPRYKDSMMVFDAPLLRFLRCLHGLLGWLGRGWSCRLLHRLLHGPHGASLLHRLGHCFRRKEGEHKKHSTKTA